MTTTYQLTSKNKQSFVEIDGDVNCELVKMSDIPGNDCCNATILRFEHEGVYWYCTREVGHKGSHIASNGVDVVAIFSEEARTKQKMSKRKNIFFEKLFKE